MIPERAWPNIGVSSIALLTGGLVGISSSPVAGVAVTAIFGGVLATTGLFKTDEIAKTLQGLVEALKTTTPTDVSTTILSSLAEFQKRLIALPATTGKLLTLFAAIFAVGIVAGSTARIQYDLETRTFPWTGANTPTSAQTALDWIVVQENLLARGYTQDQISALYVLDMARTSRQPAPYETPEALSRLFDGSRLPKEKGIEPFVFYTPRSKTPRS